MRNHAFLLVICPSSLSSLTITSVSSVNLFAGKYFHRVWRSFFEKVIIKKNTVDSCSFEILKRLKFLPIFLFFVSLEFRIIICYKMKSLTV